MYTKSDLSTILFFIIIIALVLVVVGALIHAFWYGATAEEVEVYSVGCEVTQMAYAEETTGRSSSRPVYKMGVRCDEFAYTFNITSEQFARYAVGDVVEVEVTVWEYRDGKLDNTYRLLGPVIE